MGLDESDNSLDNIFSPIQSDLTHIFAENSASIYLDDYNNGTWFGSIDTLQAQRGYWLRLSESAVLNLDTYRIIDEEEPLIYNLHYGNNLISYIGIDNANINDVLPDDVENYFTDIFTENLSATKIPELITINSWLLKLFLCISLKKFKLSFELF